MVEQCSQLQQEKAQAEYRQPEVRDQNGVVVRELPGGSQTGTAPSGIVPGMGMQRHAMGWEQLIRQQVEKLSSRTLSAI